MKRLLFALISILLLLSILAGVHADNSTGNTTQSRSTNSEASGTVPGSTTTTLSNSTLDERARQARAERLEILKKRIAENRAKLHVKEQEEKSERREEKKEELKNDIEAFRLRLREHNGELRIRSAGKNITIRDLSNEQKAIIAGNINAKTGLNLTSDDINGSLGSMLRARLSNGRFADIKVLPDTASAVALARMQAKCKERNCTVELKEVGIGNKTRAAYVIETEKGSRFLFVFKHKMKVAAEVDAETGEITKIRKPWWAFLAKEENEQENETTASAQVSN